MPSAKCDVTALDNYYFKCRAMINNTHGIIITTTPETEKNSEGETERYRQQQQQQQKVVTVVSLIPNV